MPRDLVDPRRTKGALAIAVQSLTQRFVARLDMPVIDVVELPPDLAEPLRPFLNGAQSLTLADAHRLYRAFSDLMAHRRQVYQRQIELMKAASTLEQEVGQYQRLLIDNRR